MAQPQLLELSLLPLRAALAARWSQELEPGIEPDTPILDKGILTTRLSAYPRNAVCYKEGTGQ